jgi:hypothetical protein
MPPSRRGRAPGGLAPCWQCHAIVFGESAPTFKAACVVGKPTDEDRPEGSRPWPWCITGRSTKVRSGQRQRDPHSLDSLRHESPSPCRRVGEDRPIPVAVAPFSTMLMMEAPALRRGAGACRRSSLACHGSFQRPHAPVRSDRRVPPPDLSRQRDRLFIGEHPLPYAGQAGGELGQHGPRSRSMRRSIAPRRSRSPPGSRAPIPSPIWRRWVCPAKPRRRARWQT